MPDLNRLNVIVLKSKILPWRSQGQKTHIILTVIVLLPTLWWLPTVHRIITGNKSIKTLANGAGSVNWPKQIFVRHETVITIQESSINVLESAITTTGIDGLNWDVRWHLWRRQRRIPSLAYAGVLIPCPIAEIKNSTVPWCCVRETPLRLKRRGSVVTGLIAPAGLDASI